MRIGGKPAITTKEKLHPLVNANPKPDNAIANDIQIVPIFSPKANYIVITSFFNLDESS